MARRARPAEARALTFVVQTRGEPVRLDVAVLVASEVIMSEWRMFGAARNRVQLFVRGAEHFAALRAQDAANPGRVRVRVQQNGEVVADLPLTE